MYRKIVAPLDGSKLAECALPHLEELAKGLKAKEVVLISVTERIVGRTRAPEAGEVAGVSGVYPVGVDVGKLQRQAERYLNRIAKGMQSKGIKVSIEVLLGNPAEEIIHYTEENAVDLIVMASHGRSGPSRWAFGSVADKVFRGSCVPVLMIRAPGCVTGV
ncbi:MAG TPA: universal stress protein [Dehalococcoidales bacterium]